MFFFFPHIFISDLFGSSDKAIGLTWVRLKQASETLMETANLKDDSILECYVLLQYKALQEQISKYYHFSIINTRDVCIAVTRQLASSCSRRGMVAARFTSERPGCGTRLSETFALSVAHLWFQSLRTFSATDRQR